MTPDDDRKPVEAPSPEQAMAQQPQMPTVLEELVATYPAFTWEVQRLPSEDGQPDTEVLQFIVPGPYVKVFRFPFDSESAKKLAGKLMSANIEVASPADLSKLPPQPAGAVGAHSPEGRAA